MRYASAVSRRYPIEISEGSDLPDRIKAVLSECNYREAVGIACSSAS